MTIEYNKGELKDESLILYLETKKKITTREINRVLKQKIGDIKFPIKLNLVDKIPTTALGKKIVPL